jgi:hypothetical protein
MFRGGCQKRSSLRLNAHQTSFERALSAFQTDDVLSLQRPEVKAGVIGCVMQLAYSQRHGWRIDLTQSLANFFRRGFAFIEPQGDVGHVAGLSNFFRCHFQGTTPLSQLPG